MQEKPQYENGEAANLDVSNPAADQPDGVHEDFPDKQKTVISSRPPVFASEPSVQLEPAELAQTLIGRMLAHFKLIEFVGGGGMGAVFRGLDTMLQRTVAVKVLSRDQGGDEETVRRFHNEARSAARLDHENIARVYFVGEEDGWYFIVFEFIEGTNLRDLVANGVLEPRVAFRFTLQIAEALDHASKRDVVHRDIKPSNVLITDDGRSKLVDMGLARLHHVNPHEDELTASGVTLGTFDYISPEQARDPRTADVRSDIYSLGCTLFFMLTGRPPFPEGTVLQKLLSHSSDAPPDPRKWRQDVPAELVSIMSRMLAKKPKDRFQKPSELIGELIFVGDKLGWQTATQGEPIFIEPRQTRFQWLETHLPWAVPVAFFFAFMVFFDSYWLSDESLSAGIPEYKIPARSTDVTTAPVEEIRSDESDLADLNRESEDHEEPKLDGNIDPQDAGNASSSPDQPTNLANTLVVKESPFGNAEFETLADAIEFVRMGNDRSYRIELQTEDVIEIDNIELPGKNLTIAAAADYRPVLQIRSESDDWDDSQTMFLVSNYSLTIEGIHLELVVPINTICDRWSLFEIVPGSELSLSDCTVTINNTHGDGHAYLDNVAVARLKPFRSERRSKTGGKRQNAVISLANCGVRGQASLVRAEPGQAVRIDWKNGIFVSTEPMLSMAGAESYDDEETIYLTIHDVTAITQHGLLSHYSREGASYLLKTTIESKRNIFVTATWSALIEHSLRGDEEDTELFHYVGANNYYDGVGTFWKSVTPDGESNSNSLQGSAELPMVNDTSLEDIAIHSGTVAWKKNSELDKPVHTYRLLDLAVEENTVPIVGGRMIGAKLDKLPAFRNSFSGYGSFPDN